MITSLRKVERIFVCQRNSLLEAPSTFPAISTFPIPLVSRAAADLCSITIPVKRRREDTSFFISAFINWDMTSTASMVAEPPGVAQITFELVRDDFVIFSANDTLVSPPVVEGSVTVFGTANLAHLDTLDSCCCCFPLNRCVTFRVRANNIVFDAVTTTVAVAAVNLKIEELKC